MTAPRLTVWDDDTAAHHSPSAAIDSGPAFWWYAIPPAALAIALVTVVFAVLFPNVWYGEFDVSDISIYQEHAIAMAEKQLPYRDFDLEYPPLAPALFSLPGHLGDFAAYAHWFSVVMYVLTVATVILVVLTAASIWLTNWRVWLVAVVAAAAVAAIGTIVENRFDMAVALCMTAAVLFLVRGRHLPAAFALGLGFALKLTPVILLPLLLILAGKPRRVLASAAVFTVAAALPFLPYLIAAPGGVLHVFTYHLERPLQIESVLATPFLVGQTLERIEVGIVTSYGSQGIDAAGAAAVTTAGTALMAVSLALVTWLLWRGRAVLRRRRDLIPTAALALVLAGMTFGKVLSPQFLIWLVPLVPLVLARDPWLGGLGLLTLLLTQIGFPGQYWGLVYLETPAILWLSARNVALVAMFVLAVVRLARLGQHAPGILEPSLSDTGGEPSLIDPGGDLKPAG